jgi:F-type H+-transporting ATPase subunit epsilon
MAQGFNLLLVTPVGIVFNGAVDEVVAHGPMGEFGVLADHANLMTGLIPGLLVIKSPDGSRAQYLVTGGLAEIKDGAMTVLADEATPPASADEAALHQQARAAEERLGQLSFYDDEYEEARSQLDLIRARIEASELNRSAPSSAH